MAEKLTDADGVASMAFHKQVDFHLQRGTNAAGTPTNAPKKQWDIAELCALLGGADTPKNPKTIDRWRTGRTKPSERDFRSLSRIFFGNGKAYRFWRDEFQRGWSNWARERKGFLVGKGIEPPTEYFIGREDELVAIEKALVDNQKLKCVLIQGGPGIGKTTLSRAAATKVSISKTFREEHRWFVPLEAARTDTDLRSSIAHCLGLEDNTSFEKVLTRLSMTGGLLVLDNLETCWEPPDQRASVEETLRQIAETPGVAIVVSFRGRELVRGPKWSIILHLDGLEHTVSRQLFCKIGGISNPEQPVVQKFVEVLGGIPLAIELVAMQASTYDDLELLWRRWERMGAGIAKRRDFPQSKETSLVHSIELSLSSPRTTNHARSLFAVLGQLPAGLADEDLEEVFGLDAFDACDSLLRVGLALDRKAGHRIDLLPPLREYAKRNLVDLAETVQWSDHYQDLLITEGPRLSSQEGSRAMERLQPEISNFVAMLEHCLDSLETHRLADLLSQLHRLGYYSSSSISAFFINVAEVISDGRQKELFPDCLVYAGNLELRAQRYDNALKYYQDAIPVYKAQKNARGEGIAIKSISDVFQFTGKLDDARNGYEVAIPILSMVSEQVRVADCKRCLAEIELKCRNFRAAKEQCQQALERYQELSDLLGIAMAYRLDGQIEFERDRFESASKGLAEASRNFRQAGDLLRYVRCSIEYAKALQASGKSELATNVLIGVQDTVKVIDSYTDEVAQLDLLGSLASERDIEAAYEYWNRAYKLLVSKEGSESEYARHIESKLRRWT